MTKRKRYSAGFKAKVALEAVREELTTGRTGQSAENLAFMDIIDRQFLDALAWLTANGPSPAAGGTDAGAIGSADR